MAVEDVRAALAQSRLDESNFRFFAVESLVFAVIAGLGSHSWWVFGGVFIGLPMLLAVPYLGALIIVLISGIYGVLAYSLASLLIPQQAGVIVATILVFLVALGVHFGAATHAKDLSR